MTLIEALMRRAVFAPNDGGGAAAAALAGGGDTTPPPGNTTSPGGADGAPPADDATGGETAPGSETPWWKDGQRFDATTQEWLTARGLTVDDPLDALVRAVNGHRHAEQRLGKPADQLMDRPKKGQDMGEWLREHREAFGLPEKAEGYEVKRPESWPKDAPWNEGLETGAREIALKHGISGTALQELTDLYAGEVGKLTAEAEAGFEEASTAMMQDLQKDWGDQTQQRIDIAARAGQQIAQQAGLGNDQLASVAKALSKSTGDAATIRMFHAIGEMLGDDKLEGHGSGANAFGTTPAEARAQLSKMNAEGGDWYEAVNKGDRAKMKELEPRMQQLEKLAARK